MYRNEEGVGRAVNGSSVPREEIIVTTKLWNDSHEYDQALRAFETSLGLLNLSYIDLYLVHWPVPSQGKFTEAWRALERLLAEGAVRAIGVSNFEPEHLDILLQHCEVPPVVDQVELHPRFQQRELRAYCELRDIKVQGWSPLMRGGDLSGDPVLMRIAEKHGRSVAQVVLRWHMQSGVTPIPKSSHPDRIAENWAALDFELDGDDLTAIDSLEAGHRTGPDPKSAKFG